MVGRQRGFRSTLVKLVAVAAICCLQDPIILGIPVDGAGAASVIVDEASCAQGDKDAAGTCTVPEKSWSDEVGDKFQQFLQEKIFGQKDLANKEETEAEGGFLSHLFQEEQHQKGDSKDEVAPNPFLQLFDRIANVGNEILEAVDDSKEDIQDGAFKTLLDRVRQLNEEDQSVVSGTDFLKIMQEALTKALDQLKNTFGEIMDTADASIAFSLMYHLSQEDALKNPSWKRRQHRFNEPVSKEMVVEMHDALYLSQLSYVNTVEEFREGLAKFQNNEWEMAYGTTDSLPHLPAHFMLIHKKLSPLDTKSAQTSFFPPWYDKKKDTELTVAIVVRGTKHLSDAIADALLEPVEYRGGFVHGGILESGKNLAAKYLPKLKALLSASGRDRIRLTLVGHSLGAAAASIAAMELKEHEEWMTVDALGFGCPSLLSKELSESAKDYITTVVADADVVPRMSGSSIANLLLDVLEYDWTDNALEDVEFTVDKARNSLPFGNILPARDSILDWVKTVLERDFKPKFNKRGKRKRLESVLIPPGNCIHFFRDGVGYSGVTTPCSFFSSVDLARTLVDDHLVMSGYHRALVTIARDWEDDYNFDFRHDISSIPC